MDQMATIPVDCCGTDVPTLCIASLTRQHSPDDILRDVLREVTRTVDTLPSSTPNVVTKWEHDPIVGTDVLVREVIPLEEKMMFFVMDQMATIPVDCCGTDVPTLCIASLTRQHSPDDILRDVLREVTRTVDTLPSSTPNVVTKWEHDPIVGTDVLVREVIPLEEKMTYKKNSLHKMVGGSQDISIIADPDINGGVMLCIAEQSHFLNN